MQTLVKCSLIFAYMYLEIGSIAICTRSYLFAHQWPVVQLVIHHSVKVLCFVINKSSGRFDIAKAFHIFSTPCIYIT